MVIYLIIRRVRARQAGYNRPMFSRLWKTRFSPVIFLLVAILVLNACTGTGPTMTPEATADKTLTPSPQGSPSAANTSAISQTIPTASPSNTPSTVRRKATATIPPPPTPTPFTYKIKKGDTMLGIALFFHVSLDQLTAANPTVDPNLMPVGTSLVIPLSTAGTPTLIPTATPVPVALDPPDCYPSADGSVWCFALAHNASSSQALENLSAWMTLYSSNGDAITSTLALLPLDRLPAGTNLPLAALFPASPKTGTAEPLQGVTGGAELVTALEVSAGDKRYLDLSVQIQGQAVSAHQAVVQGQISLPPGNPPASKVRLAVVAYTASGQVAGLRQWDLPGSLASGGSQPFNITVYSAGPPISRVEVVGEARP